MIDLSFFMKTLLILEKNVNFVNVFPIINEYKQSMKNYFSFLFLVAMLLGTSSFTYETVATNSTEYRNIRSIKVGEPVNVQRHINLRIVDVDTLVLPTSDRQYISLRQVHAIIQELLVLLYGVEITLEYL